MPCGPSPLSAGASASSSGEPPSADTAAETTGGASNPMQVVQGTLLQQPLAQLFAPGEPLPVFAVFNST